MKDFKFSLDRELDFMLKYQLNANELLVIKLIFYSLEGHKEYIQKFFSQSNVLNLREILLSLQNKGIITKKYTIPEKGEKFIPEDVIFNQNILKNFLQHSQVLGLELFTAYPAYTRINSKVFSLRNITKLYKSLDDFCFSYGKMIGFSLEKHEEVMELLEWAKENNKITSGICDFVASMKWEDFRQMRDDELEDDNWNTNELI